MVHVTEKLNIYIYEFITTLLSEDGQMDNLHTLARKSCIIKQIIICMKRDSITSLRQLYYNSPLVFKNQTQSNKILGLITKEIELTREQLHIHASEKGLIASKHIKINNLKVNHKNIYIQSDIGDKYYVILNGVKPLVLSKLKFVLIVEKETIFKQFVTSNFLEMCV
ncbi:meiotic recombination protein SPO11, putative (SPO11) [Babesia microti strain RI]|uniref:Meiotic recombination protein SPO11, putative (SPO11) n=1 Tax=Babesia microti (strain RI) TaxID=1133968 RepID=I7I8C4_BABMR|nr:meiotic recombination protein SPO11, putative (SPO11) [Babesia microti strain RI]CCF73053.1 meiotic recombination protein SPO11, putative (SPO11) [Babesia microti strain RI]|eukprot:XP_012647662.1 meiotic recombination protein SPO11, putative (SPO11) [Babesia microti strain RI]